MGLSEVYHTGNYLDRKMAGSKLKVILGTTELGRRDLAEDPQVSF